MSQEQWSAQLKAQKAERRVGGLSGVDARLAAAAATRPEKAAAPDLGLADDFAADPQVRAARLAEARRESLRQQAAALAEEEQAAEAEAAEEAAQQASSAAAPGPTNPALKIVQSRLRWYLWGAVIPSFGLTVLALDTIYLIRLITPASASKLPRPYLWEKITLMVLTALLVIAATLNFVVIMAVPTIVIGLLHSVYNLL